MGGTMRLGAYEALITPDSRVHAIYGTERISERHRHRYEVNLDFEETLAKHGMIFSAKSPDGVLPEIVEIKNHPWFIGVQFHPEYKSTVSNPHPLFVDFIKASIDYLSRK